MQLIKLQPDSRETVFFFLQGGGADWEHREGQCEVDVSGRCLGQNSGWVFESNQARRRGRRLSQCPVCGSSAEGAGGNGEGRQPGSVCTLSPVVCPEASSIWPKHQNSPKKKKKTYTKKKRCWKSTSHFVREQFFQTQACVTPSLISNVAKPRSSRFTRCIYDEPEAMIDLPVAICSRHGSMP